MREVITEHCAEKGITDVEDKIKNWGAASAVGKGTIEPFLENLGTEDSEPQGHSKPFGRNAIKPDDPIHTPDENADAPTTEPAKVGFIKPLVALVTAGFAAFAGDSKEPEKQEGKNWFQRNYKTFLRVIAGLLAVDMVQGMLRKQEPWTVRAFQSVSGNFRGKS